MQIAAVTIRQTPPLYLGVDVIVFGAAQSGGSRKFAAVTTTYLMIAMPWEESSLGGRSGPITRATSSECRGASFHSCTRYSSNDCDTKPSYNP